jgi:peptidoglycan/xylan/chitin deacetylase (PgdA/CDA1 family)
MEIKMKIWTMDVEKNITSAIEFSKLLYKNKIRGEFYFCGHLVEKFPGVCKNISKRHMIGGHGYRHERFAQLSKSKQEEAIVKTKRAFEKNDLTLEHWRFPYFSFTNLSFHLLVKNGVRTDSSLRDKWTLMPTAAIWLCAIKNENKITIPYPFPSKLKEIPWSAVDLSGEGFLNHEGRLVLHCYNYENIKDKVKSVIKSIR